MKLILILLFFATGCSSYVNRMHYEIDRAERGGAAQISKQKQFDQYRNGNSYYNQLKNPRTLSSNGSSSNNKMMNPNIKRQYSTAKRRYKSDDLVDNSNEGSLWSNRGQESFLFSKNNFKRNGDIIIIEVMKNLKQEIALELSRAFPKQEAEKSPASEDGKDGEKTEQAPKAPAPTPTQANASTKDDDPSKVYDKISSVVIEEINKDHLLLRGRKDVLYDATKRTVEVQALISRKDINDNDLISSKSIIESNVTILR